MNPVNAVKLSFTSKSTNIDIQNVDKLALKIYEMTITEFSIKDKLRKIQFFKKTFLLADTSMKLVLRIPFFLLSKVNINFSEVKELF